MAETLPYMSSSGLIPRILDKIKEAKTPDRFSQDFLGSVLGFSSGSAKPFIPLAKRLGLINSDGTPSPLYSRFRGGSDESRAAMAAAIRIGYAPLYKRNEFVDRLDRKKLEGLIREVTGAEQGSTALRAMAATFDALKAYADFDASLEDASTIHESSPESTETNGPTPPRQDSSPVRFGYTININLPNTNDISVFNAIFKSLKDHLL